MLEVRKALYVNLYAYRFWDEDLIRTCDLRYCSLTVQHLVWQHGTKLCRYNWHSAGSLGWPFPMVKYKCIFRIKCTQAILSTQHSETVTVTWVTFGYRLVVFVWRSCCSRRLRSRLCTGSSSCAESSRTPRSRSSRLCSLRTLPSPQLQRSAYDTHTRPFNGPSSGTTRVSRYQKRKSNLWTLLKQETVSGSVFVRLVLGVRWAICKSAPRCRQTTTPAPHHAVFYGCPSCRPIKVR